MTEQDLIREAIRQAAITRDTAKTEVERYCAEKRIEHYQRFWREFFA